VTLAWTHNPANQAYQAHCATIPYFTPTDATRRAWVTAAPWSYTDPVPVVGDPNTNYFYLTEGQWRTDYRSSFWVPSGSGLTAKP
jgi:hypothetical protein